MNVKINKEEGRSSSSHFLNSAHHFMVRYLKCKQLGMAALNRDDGEVFLTQLEEEEGRYDSRKNSRIQPPPHSTRPRIPSVKEVGEKSEGPNWTMSSPAQNLAAALNDPVNREYDLFTRTWGMYFTPNASLPPSNIPDIQLGDFLRYLKETAAVSSNSMILHLHVVCMFVCRCIVASIALYMYM